MTANQIAKLFSFSRIVSFPIILVSIITGKRELTAWLYLLLFSTDAWDGVFPHVIGKDSEARRKLDSYGDVMYMIAGVIGFTAFESAFFMSQLWIIGPILLLYFSQFIIAISKWGMPTAFHTYSAKLATFVQVIFLCFTFFFGIWELLFWITVGLSLIDLLEELSLTLVLKKYRTGIEYLYAQKIPAGRSVKSFHPGFLYAINHHPPAVYFLFTPAILSSPDHLQPDPPGVFRPD